MKKRKEERRGPTLFDFVEDKKRERAEARDFSEEFLLFVKSRGSVTKTETLQWAKSRGVTTAEFIRAVEKLVSEKRIRKRLNDEGELIYEAFG